MEEALSQARSRWVRRYEHPAFLERGIVLVRELTAFSAFCATDSEFVDPGGMFQQAIPDFKDGFRYRAFYEETVENAIKELSEYNEMEPIDLNALQFELLPLLDSEEQPAPATEGTLSFEIQFRYVPMWPLEENPSGEISLTIADTEDEDLWLGPGTEMVQMEEGKQRRPRENLGFFDFFRNSSSSPSVTRERLRVAQHTD